jgi:hypothetical protein
VASYLRDVLPDRVPDARWTSARDPFRRWSPAAMASPSLD